MAQELGDPESAVSRAYYALYHTTIVLLEVVRNRTRERWAHDQLERAFLEEFCNPGFIFNARDGDTWKQARAVRIDADYRLDRLSQRTAQRILDRVEDLVTRMKYEIERST